MTANAESQSISLEYELPYAPVKVWRADRTRAARTVAHVQ
jgi:hypothetical protein